MFVPCILTKKHFIGCIIVRYSIINSGNNTVITGTEGGIIKVTPTADKDFKGGSIRLDNILLVSPDQTEIKPTPYDLTVVIQDIKANGNDDQPTCIYNLSGQRLTAAKPGVNIVNGRKVVVK